MARGVGKRGGPTVAPSHRGTTPVAINRARFCFRAAAGTGVVPRCDGATVGPHGLPTPLAMGTIRLIRSVDSVQ